jgi:virginiamycin B lyase
MRRLLFPLLLLALAFPAAASAVPTLNGQFAVTGKPERLTQGPDGNMWVILSGVANDVAKVAPDGTVTEYDLPGIMALGDIAAGPANRLWVTTGAGVASFAADDPIGTTSATTNGDLSGAQGLVIRGDELWVAKNATLYHAPLADPANDVPIPFGGMTSSARGLALHDDVFWIADFGAKAIFSVTPGGTVTPYQVDGMGPQEVVGGPPGQVAYTNPNNEIGRIAPGGSALKTDTGMVDPTGIAFGADGAYWSAQVFGPSLGRLTPEGQFSTLPMPANSRPRHIAAGPGNTLWVSLEGDMVTAPTQVARITGVEPASPPPPPPPNGTDTVAPQLSAFSLSATRFRLGSALPRVAQRRPRTGTTIRFTLNEGARVTLSFTRLLKGKRVRGRCVKPRRSNRKRRSCTRRAAVRRQLGFNVSAGQRRIRFQGRLNRRQRLRPGRYELRLTAVDAAGNRSRTLRKRFTLLPAKKRKR